MRESRIDNRSIGSADWLSLAAAPTFALMALVTAYVDGWPGALGMTSHHGGMLTMYALMAVFHLPRWLKR